MVKVIVALLALLAVVESTQAASVLQTELAKPKVELIGGLVLYRVFNDEIQYVLLQKKTELDDWSVPKGHIEEGEDAGLGAIRETFEEIEYLYPIDYSIYSLEKIYFEYTTNDDELKKVTLFPAKSISIKPMVISDEHNAFIWINYESAVSIIKKQYKDAFIQAHAFVRVQESL